MEKPEWDKLDGFTQELNDSGFPNREISWQTGLSQSYVEKSLRGRKGFVWKLPSSPPLTKRWTGGSERASMELKRMKQAIGNNLAWLWSVVDESVQPVTRQGPGRPAAFRPHGRVVAQAIEVLSLVCGVSQSEIWRWVHPSRARHIYRTRQVRPGKKTEGKDG